jgi:integrase
MNLPVQSLPAQQWCWPINNAYYDRTPELRPDELKELRRKVRKKKSPFRSPTWAILDRLVRPIEDVLEYVHAPLSKRHCIVRAVMTDMAARGTSFWAWSLDEWRESIGRDLTQAAQRYGWKGEFSHPARPFLPAIAYLLDVHPDAATLIDPIGITAFARRIFGQEALDAALRPLLTILGSWGYTHANKTITRFGTCVFYLLVQNRSPCLEDLSIELLERCSRGCTVDSVKTHVFQVSRALNALGIIKRHLPGQHGNRKSLSVGEEWISSEWLSWCDRWRKQATCRAPGTVYYPLLKVGRWLKVVHPEVSSPAQWTYELAGEFVALVSDMKIGDWSDQITLDRIEHQVGQPMLPNSKIGILRGVRTFFRDCQEWGWIAVRFNPARALRAPRALQSLIGPAPRVIDKEFWAKILWAAMNLERKDLPVDAVGRHQYPFEMVRALAVVWCFAALRSNEIVRLRVGCIRWQQEDVTVPETGDVLPQDAVCFLDIPVNKTTTAYTKAVHTLVGKRIDEWEKLRPSEQPQAWDKTTGEALHYLFSYRGTRVSRFYINDSLIPTLCRKAGIPEQDSRGAITSHRARATIASQLYNAKEPLTIFELKEYLGHKELSSTQHYVKVDPTKLASRVAKAGYLEQNMATIEVLLDQDAVINGAASRGEVWKYYDLGHGFCTNPFWVSCAHRMACARCPFYRPKTATAEQLVEGKANLVRMLEFVSLTEEEKLLVTEGIDLHQVLIEKLADVPTPVGLTPRELEAKSQEKGEIIPLKTVHRSRRKG